MRPIYKITVTLPKILVAAAERDSNAGLVVLSYFDPPSENKREHIAQILPNIPVPHSTDLTTYTFTFAYFPHLIFKNFCSRLGLSEEDLIAKILRYEAPSIILRRYFVNVAYDIVRMDREKHTKI